RIHLLSGCSAATGDDRAGVAHALAFGSGLTSDKRRDRFLNVFFDELSGLDLRVATDFADHDDGFRVGIFFKQRQQIDVSAADDRVATDADTGRLAEAYRGRLVNGFVGQSTGLGDDTDLTGLVNVTWHDADLALTWRDDAWAVRADQAALGTIQRLLHRHHVEYRNAFRNTNDQLDAGIDRFQNRIRRERRRYKNHAGISAGFFARFRHGIEHRQVGYDL